MLQKLEYSMNMLNTTVHATPVLPIANTLRRTSTRKPSTSTTTLVAVNSSTCKDVIPQMDGIELVKESLKCENCRELFGTSELLENHTLEYDYVCEECAMCFKGQYNYDLHEHLEHPEDYFKYNKVSPTTKMQLTRRLTSALTEYCILFA